MNIQALMAAGYTAKQALNYLAKVYPALSGKIQTAAHAGYAADKILNIIGKHGVKSLKQFAKGKAESPPYADEQSQNPLIRGAEANRKTTEYNKRNNPALRTGQALGSAAAAYALSRSAPQAPEHAGAGSQVLHGQVLGAQQELPFHQKRIAGQSPLQLPGQPQLGYNPQQQQQQPPQPPQPQPSMPPQQAVNPVEPVQEKPVLPRASEIFEGMGVAESLRNIIKGESGSIGGAKEKITPKDAAAVLNFTLKGPQKQWLNSQKEPLENMVSRFMQEEAEAPKEPPPVEQARSVQAAPVEQERAIQPHPVEQMTEKPIELPPALKPVEPKSDIKTIKPKVKKTQPPKEGEQVATKDGRFGKVISIKDGIVKFTEGGKEKTRKLEDIYAEPDYIKRAKIVFDPTTVPEEARSSALGFLNVAPDRSSILLAYSDSPNIVRFFRKDGKPIGEEEIRKLKEGVTLPMSTGETYLGAYDKKIADSRGAHSSSEFKTKAQSLNPKEKEPDDPKKHYWFEDYKNEFTTGVIKGFMDIVRGNGSDYGKAATKVNAVNKFLEEYPSGERPKKPKPKPKPKKKA